jgi:hypothetical protein
MAAAIALQGDYNSAQLAQAGEAVGGRRSSPFCWLGL